MFELFAASGCHREDAAFFENHPLDAVREAYHGRWRGSNRALSSKLRAVGTALISDVKDGRKLSGIVISEASSALISGRQYVASQHSGQTHPTSEVPPGGYHRGTTEFSLRNNGRHT